MRNREEAEKYLRSNFLNRDRIPLCVVAWSGDRPCGTVSLDVQDLAIRPNQGPWLVNTFVHPDFRGRSTAHHHHHHPAINMMLMIKRMTHAHRS